MNEKEAFERGFLRGLAEKGVLPSEADALLEKRAWLGEAVSAVKGLGTLGLLLGAGTVVGVPLLAGSTLGKIRGDLDKLPDREIEYANKLREIQAMEDETSRIRKQIERAKWKQKQQADIEGYGL